MSETTTTTTRAALYARISTTGHGQDVGLQLDELRRVAEQRGWQVVEEFIDEGVSGDDENRPAWNRLLDQAREGRVDVVAVWKLDRLARSVRHLQEVADCLCANGVGLVSVRDGHIDTTSPSGRFALLVLGSVEELEQSLMRERAVIPR